MALRRRSTTTFETIPIPELLERLKGQRTGSRTGSKGNAATRKDAGEPQSREPKRILSLSYDVALLDSRQMLLEQHGYEVRSVIGLASALEACQERAYDLVIIGHSIPLAHKRKMLEQLRAVCDTPVLALQRTGERLQDADYFFSPVEGPRAFLDAVDRILGTEPA